MKIVDVEILKEEIHDVYGITRKLMKKKIIEKYKIEKDFIIIKVINRELNELLESVKLKLEIEVE